MYLELVGSLSPEESYAIVPLESGVLPTGILELKLINVTVCQTAGHDHFPDPKVGAYPTAAVAYSEKIKVLVPRPTTLTWRRRTIHRITYSSDDDDDDDDAVIVEELVEREEEEEEEEDLAELRGGDEEEEEGRGRRQRREASPPTERTRRSDPAAIIIPALDDNAFAFSLHFKENTTTTFVSNLTDQTLQSLSDRLKNNACQRLNGQFGFLPASKLAIEFESEVDGDRQVGLFKITLPPLSKLVLPHSELAHLLGFSGGDQESGFVIETVPTTQKTMAVFVNKDNFAEKIFVGSRRLPTRTKVSALYDQIETDLAQTFRDLPNKFELIFSHTPIMNIASVTIDVENSLCDKNLAYASPFFKLVFETLEKLNSLIENNLIVEVSDDYHGVAFIKSNFQGAAKEKDENVTIVFRAGKNVAERIGITAAEHKWPILVAGNGRIKMKILEKTGGEEDEDIITMKKKYISLCNDFAKSFTSNKPEIDHLVAEAKEKLLQRKTKLEADLATEIAAKKIEDEAEKKLAEDEAKKLAEEAAKNLKKMQPKNLSKIQRKKHKKR